MSTHQPSESTTGSIAGYPPEPWDLRGRMYVSFWLVPADGLPEAVTAALPTGARPVLVRSKAVIGTAWVVYGPGGVLQYNEVMSTLLVRYGRRLMPTVTHIWVDSETSRDGGRELWGIPKELAAFRVPASGEAAAELYADTGPTAGAGSYGVGYYEARADGRAFAAGTVGRGLTLPGRWPVSFQVVQDAGGFPRVSPVQIRGRLGVHRATWTPDPRGPLGFLAGRRPFLTLGLADFEMRFGRDRSASAHPATG